MEDIEIVEEINDGNLFLRKVSKDDISFFYHSLTEKETINYLSLGPLRSLEHSKRLIKTYLRSWDKCVQFNYIIELRNDRSIERIGSVSLWAINWHHSRSGVGIWIIPKYWDRGFGSRTIDLIKMISFNYLNLNRIEAYIATENERSISMFKKCDFIEEGVLRKYLRIENKFQDALVVACLKN